VYEEFSK